MVGDMIGTGTSSAMAAVFLVGQLRGVVDLDGLVLFKSDRANTGRYSDGYIPAPNLIRVAVVSLSLSEACQ
jgi:hypothetical protein